MLLPGSGTFDVTGHEVDQQDNAGAVRQVPGLVISRIVSWEMNALNSWLYGLKIFFQEDVCQRMKKRHWV
jgi:hypothetical protein